MKIPFLSFTHSNVQIKKEILKSFEDFFDNQWYVLGKNIQQFEQKYATFNKTEYAVGVSNGLDALFLALKALHIGKGDEVIVPSNTYIATVLAVTYTGGIPVFVEPRLDSYNINPELIEDKISSKTKAIIPVHLYGQSCEMDAISAIANKYNLKIIEDNAQAHGSRWNGQLTGSWGDISATSFYPGKNLGALGDGGACTTNSKEFADKLKVLRNYGSQKKYYNEMIGYNMRLDECQAGFLSIKLPYLKEWTNQRKEIALWYDKYLKTISNIILPKITEGAEHVYHLYVIRTDSRNELQEYLTKQGIGTLIHYPIPPHLQEAYISLGYKKGDLPIAEHIAETCLSLPLYIGLKEENIQYIAHKIKLFFENVD